MILGHEVSSRHLFGKRLSNLRRFSRRDGDISNLIKLEKVESRQGSLRDRSFVSVWCNTFPSTNETRRLRTVRLKAIGFWLDEFPQEGGDHPLVTLNNFGDRTSNEFFVTKNRRRNVLRKIIGELLLRNLLWDLFLERYRSWRFAIGN